MLNISVSRSSYIPSPEALNMFSKGVFGSYTDAPIPCAFDPVPTATVPNPSACENNPDAAL